MIKGEDGVSKIHRHKLMNTEGITKLIMRRHYKKITKCFAALRKKFRAHRKLHFQAVARKRWDVIVYQVRMCFSFLKLVFLGCGDCKGKGWGVGVGGRKEVEG